MYYKPRGWPYYQLGVDWKMAMGSMFEAKTTPKTIPERRGFALHLQKIYQEQIHHPGNIWPVLTIYTQENDCIPIYARSSVISEFSPRGKGAMLQ